MSPDVFRDTIRRWTGRFQYPHLLSGLMVTEAGSTEIAKALLDDFGDAAALAVVADHLIQSQKLSAVRVLVEQSDLAATTEDLIERLEDAERAAIAQVMGQVQRLRKKAHDLDLSIDLDEEALLAAAREDPRAILAELEIAGTRLSEAAEQRAEKLRVEAGRLAGELHSDGALMWLSEIRAAIDSGALKTVARVLGQDGGIPITREPWFLPYPPTADIVGDPEEALQRILSDNVSGTAAFRRAFDTAEARELASAYCALDGKRASAQRLADFLCKYLRDELTAVTEGPEGVGHMLPFYALHLVT